MNKKTILLITILVTLSFSVSATTLNDGLTHAFDFHEGSGSTTTDAFNNSIVGNITGGVWVTGINGNALYSDGGATTRIELGDRSKDFGTLDNEGDSTVCLWHTFNESPANGYFFGTHTGTEAYAMAYNTINGYWFYFAGSGECTGIEAGYATNQYATTHVCVTLNGSSSPTNDIGSIYINGSLADTGSCDMSQIVGTDDDVELMRRGGTDNQPVEGIYDELYVWNRVLSADEISSLFNNGAGTFYEDFGLGSVPSINFSTLNATSARLNNKIWQTNKSQFVISQDKTMTVTFETNVDSNCSIGKNDYNYSTMISDDPQTKCSTTATTEHSCTLGTSQSLSWVNSENIFIACSSSDSLAENTTSSSGALATKLIPTVTTRELSESYYLDLDTDGTNYGRTSEGWASAGENKTKYLFPVSTSNDAYMIIRNTWLDASLNIYVNNDYIANIPSDSSGTGEYKTYAFKINTTLTENSSVLIEAPSGNTDTTYIDYLAFLDTSNISDGVVGENNLIGLFVNVSNKTRLNLSYGVIWDESLSVINQSYDDVNYNSISDDEGYGNIIMVYNTPSVNENYTISYRANFTNYDDFVYGDNNYSIAIDSTPPVIHTVTTNLSALVGNVYGVVINVTELYDSHVQITANDSSHAPANLTEMDNQIWNYSVNYTLPYTKRITISAVDKAGHTTIGTYDVRASNTSITNTGQMHNYSWGYDTFFYNISDASTIRDIHYVVNFSITSTGDAEITDLNLSYVINDTYPTDLSVTYGDYSINNTIFTDGTTQLNWLSDSWDNNITNPITFENEIRYNLNNSLTLEWENSGVSNTRLFYASMTNNNRSLNNISVHIPIRTTYNTNGSSIDLFKCTASINWGAKTCGVWTEITNEFYSQSDETYHWGTSNDNFPTVDTTGDGKKDHVYFKIPSIASDGKVMFKIDLDSGNGETSWTTPTNDSGSPSGGGGGGGGGSSSDGNQVTGNTIVPSSTAGTSTGTISTFVKTIFQMIEDLWNKTKFQLQKVDFGDPTTITLLLGIIIIVAGTLALSRPTKGRKARTADLRI